MAAALGRFAMNNPNIVASVISQGQGGDEPEEEEDQEEQEEPKRKRRRDKNEIDTGNQGEGENQLDENQGENQEGGKIKYKLSNPFYLLATTRKYIYLL